jgi:hypothetical protein
MVGVTLIVASVGTWSASARAKDSEKKGGCSLATIKGTYGIQMSGTRPSAPGGPAETVIGVVIRRYDGMGGLEQIDNIKGSLSGWVPDRPGSGTYTVDETCSGVAVFTPGPGILLEERFVIVDDGNEIRSMTSLPPPVMVTTVQKRTDTR